MIPMEYFCMMKHCDIEEQMLLKVYFCFYIPAAVRKYYQHQSCKC